MPRLIVDVGAFHLKALFVNSPHVHAVVVPCAVGASPVHGRGLTGAALANVETLHGLVIRRPLDKGLVIDPLLLVVLIESLVVDHVPRSKWNPKNHNKMDLVLTLPQGTPDAVVRELVKALWHRFPASNKPLNNGRISHQLNSLTFVTSSLLSLLAFDLGMNTPLSDRGTAVVCDIGHSGSVVTPYVDYHPVKASVIRGRIGGQLITNRLKEHLSFNQINLMEDGALVNFMKERCCMVASSTTVSELRAAPVSGDSKRIRLKRQRRLGQGDGDSSCCYVLPTHPSIPPSGCLLESVPSSISTADFENLQFVVLRNERFLLPELIFSPSDVGVREPGLLSQAVECFTKEGSPLCNLPIVLHRALSRRCVCFGGCCEWKGFVERLAAEWTTEFGCDGGVARLPASSFDKLLDSNVYSTADGFVNQAMLPLIGAAVLWGGTSAVEESTMATTINKLRQRIEVRSTVFFAVEHEAHSEAQEEVWLERCCEAARFSL